MQNFRNNFKTRKLAFISAFSVCLTVALSEISIEQLKYLRYHIFFYKTSGVQLVLHQTLKNHS